MNEHRNDKAEEVINGISNEEVAEAKRQWLEGCGYPAFVVAGVFEDLPIPDDDKDDEPAPKKPEVSEEKRWLINLLEGLIVFLKRILKQWKE